MSQVINHGQQYAGFWIRFLIFFACWQHVPGPVAVLLALSWDLLGSVPFCIRRGRELARVDRLPRRARVSDEGPDRLRSAYATDGLRALKDRERLGTLLQLVACWTYNHSVRVVLIVAVVVRHRIVSIWRIFWLRHDWNKALTQEKIVAGREKAVPFLSRPRTTPDLDIEAFVKPRRIGLTLSDIAAHGPRIAEICGATELVLIRGDKVGVGLIKMYWTDPLQRLLPIQELPAAPKIGDATPLVYGVRAGRRPAWIDLALSLLIGGITGSGKSSLMWALFCSIIWQRIPVELWVSDAKGGVEMRAFAPHVDPDSPRSFRVARYVTSADATVKLVTDALKVMRDRQLKQGGRKHRATLDSRHIIVVLDELLPLQDMLSGVKGGVKSPLGQIAFEGRASGVSIWANAQIGQKSAIGDFRDLVPQRLAMKTKSAINTDMILGDDATKDGALCHTLNLATQKGVGYSTDDGNNPTRFRAAYVDDEAMDRIAQGLLPLGMKPVDEDKVVDVAPETVYVYKVYGPMPEQTGLKLYYVGISNKPGLRFAQHDKRDYVEHCPICPDHGPCRWWNIHVTPFMADPERCPDPTKYKDRKTAKSIEQTAIEDELPVMNKVHNGGNRLQRRARAIVRGGFGRRKAAKLALEDDEKPARKWRALPRRQSNPVSPISAVDDDLADAELEELSPVERQALLDGVGYGAE